MAEPRIVKMTGTDQHHSAIFLDRTVITTPAAQDALEGILAAGWYDKRFADLDAAATSTLAMLLRMYAEFGRPPSLEEIATATARARSETERILDALHQHDLLLRDPADGSIRGAYPFTETVTAHTVTLQRTGRMLHTMCAIDALGAGAMCHQDATVRSHCHGCGAAICVDFLSNGFALGQAMPPATILWTGFKPSCGCLAESLCPELIFFCSDQHLEQWRAAGDGGDGRRLALEEGLQVGKALFARRALGG